MMKSGSSLIRLFLNDVQHGRAAESRVSFLTYTHGTGTTHRWTDGPDVWNNYLDENCKICT